MNTKLYVEHLAAATTEADLRDLFAPFGNVAEVNLPVDRSNGRPRGFGFVTMATPEGARAALHALNGTALANGILSVSPAPPRIQRTTAPRQC